MVRVTHEPGVPAVAICGMAMRLPGGISTSEQLWDALLSKKDARREIPSERYNIDAFYNPESTKTGVVRTRHGYFIDHVDLAQFDASFFSMTRSELEKLDPQHRLLLEVTRECLENAGEVNWRGRDIGCYVGVFGEDWLDMHAKDTQDAGMYRITGYGDFLLGNRISYEYDFKGPSVTVKTGCSSSLICLHMATTAIRNGEISAAVVGGSNLIMSPTMTQAMFDQGVLSPNGSCRTFDADADGYARGEAINTLYVKRLDLALRDGNPIRAIIRGSASNCDGKTPGIAHPSSESHEALIRSCYYAAGLRDFGQTGLVECHGTGTATGDPLEATAVANVFGGKGVYISSVKPNLGHSEGASGLTSVIKCVLALENKTIPPNIKFDKPSPKIPFDRGLRVPTEVIPWPKDCQERVSINSFGIGGANAHVILDSADSYGGALVTNGVAPTPSPRRHQLLLYTANHPESVRKGTADCREYVEQNPHAVGDLAYTLGLRREHLPIRSFAVSDGTSPLAFSPPAKSSSIVPEVAFVFTGQGAQWATMGSCLMVDFPSALRDIEHMDEILQRLPGLAPKWSIQDELSKPADISRVDEAEFSQPLCTAVQIVVTNLLRQWGVSPAVVVGHSSGEIAAAYASGALTMEEAILCAYLRGLATKKQKRQGAMAAVGLGKKQVAEFLGDSGVVIACENSPASTTLSGDQGSIDSVVDKIKQALPDVFARKLKVRMAYHSNHMTEIGEQYEDWLRAYVSGQPPKVPLYSSVTDQVIAEPRLLDAAYWRANLESPVLFHTVVEKLLAERPPSILLEVGPHSALAGPLRQIMKGSGVNSPYVSTLVRNAHDTASLLTAAGTLWASGIPLNLEAIVPPQGQVLTSLPTYPWHHDTRYWHESRLSQEWRLRSHARHDVLGAPVIECSHLEPVWRNMLRVEDVPWVRDHVVGGDVVFPGAGYVAMAGEAVRQVSSATDSGFTVRRLTISAAMILHEGTATETMLTMRPLRLTNSLDSRGWFEFSVASCSGGAWVKHCVGQVRAGIGADSDAKGVLDKSTFAHPRKVPSASWYHTMRKAGLNYGPRFQGLQDISADPTRDVAAARIVDAPGENESAYALHPASIDMCIQLFSAAAARGRARNFGGMAVPTYFGEICVGSSVAVADGRRSISVEASATASAKGAITGTCVAASDDGALVLHMNDVRLSPLDDGSSGEMRDGHAGVRLAWKPDPNFLPVSGLIQSRKKVRTPYPLVQRLVLAVCAEAADRLQDNKALTASTDPSPDHLSRYAQWLRGQVDAAAAQGSYPFVEDVPSLLALSSAARRQVIHETARKIQETEAAHVGTAIMRVMDNIEGIFSGQTDTLEMLMQDGILTKLYNMADGWDYTRLLDLLSHAKPHLRILEVGAGTGGTTAVVLAPEGGLFDARGRRKFSSYTYTDISAGLFAAAKERFKDVPGLEYRALDISKDPEEQGFEMESYDLIIATNVLHATESLGTTLANVRKMLRPGGKLLLQELCTSSKWPNLIMGVLPGWWLGESDGRSEEPYVSPDRWVKELAAAGFGIGQSGAEAVMLDDEEPYTTNATIIATAAAPGSLANHQPPSTTVVDLLTEDQHGPIASSMSAALVERGFAVRFMGLGQAAENDVLSILDMEGDAAFLDNIQSPKLEAFKALAEGLARQQHAMLWLTRPCQTGCVEPQFAQIIGLARTLRNETGLELATLELDWASDQGQSAEDAVCAVWEKFQKRSREGEDFDPDYEYALDRGVIKIPRFQWISVADELSAAPQGLEPVQTGAKTSKMLEIGKRGSLRSLGWVEKPQTSPLVGEEVRVHVQAVGMNFKDILIAMGVVDGTKAEGNGLGCECAGVISDIGPDVSGLSVGDRVVVLAGNSYSTILKTTAGLCARMPDQLSFEEGATMPCVFGTVIHGLLEMARLERGQSVLIHSACGGVGLAAIQICQASGAEIYATVGNEEKIRYLEENFDIPRSRIFNSRDASFLPGVMRETGGRGVDVVLNSLSGDLLHASWNCVAEFGKMVEIGKRDFIGQGRLAMDPFEANRTFFGVDIAQMCAERPRQIQKLLEKCMLLHQHGAIRPIPLAQAFDAAHIHDAFRFMQKGDHIGKIVVRMPTTAGDSVLQTASTRGSFQLRPDAAYLLVGGLGGLGRSISTWLAEHGAKHLVYLSRSGGDANLGHDTFVQELAAMGCSAHIVAGSVANLVDVERVVSDVAARLSVPIAGVLQMSMVLRDGGFPQMTHDDWTAVAAPKVRGTWNLHKALAESKQDLDFFVLFSSFSGLVGQWGQANYASANTFLDAFTQFRHGLGLPCSVIDIGPMDDVGYVSQNQAILETFRATGVPVLGEQMLLDALELAMRPGTCIASPNTKDVDDTNKSIEDYTFMNSSQLGIGLRMTQPINTPGNRCIWKRDVRMAQYRNLESELNDSLDMSQSGSGSDNSSSDALRALVARVSDSPRVLVEPESIAILAHEMAQTLAGFLMRSPDEVEQHMKGSSDQQTLAQSLGMDSLVAIELRNWCRQRLLGSEVSVLEVMGAKSLEDLARTVAEGLMVKMGVGVRDGQEFLLMKAP